MSQSFVLLSRLFAVTVMVSGIFGCGSDTETADIPVRIEADRLEGNAPLSIQFGGRAQGGLDAELAFEWRFGDEGSSTEESPQHTFDTPGEYDVELVVRRSDGGSGRAVVQVTVSPSTDFAIADVLSAPQRAKAGDELNVTWSVQNTGAPAIGEWSYTLVMSEDRELSEEDVAFGTVTESEELAGERIEGRELSALLPDEVESGDYFIGVVADREARVGDSNRSNNVAWTSGRLQVRNPTDTGPDLVICGLGVPAFNALEAGVPATVQRDDQLSVEVCLGNNGNRPVGAGSFTVFMSQSDTLDGSEIQVGEKRNLALGSGDRETTTLLIDISAQIAAGDWYLFAVADADESIDEQQETNNDRRYADQIRVVEAGEVDGVDLVITDLSLGLDRAYWGQSLPASISLTNRGNTPVQRFFVIRFTAESLEDSSDTQVYSHNLEGLGAGESVVVEVGLPINRRLSEGEYRIKAVVDPTNSTDDVNLANNGRTQQQAVMLGGEPSVDLAVDGVSVAPGMLEAGAMLRVSGRIRNLGSDPSGVFDYSVVLSPDSAFDLTDPIVASGTQMNVDGGSAFELELQVVVPVDLDQQVPAWFVGVVADPQDRVTGETSEDNNVDFSLESVVITGSTGGCSEDDFEPNDSAVTARIIEYGSYAGLGSCGNADWYQVTVSPQAVANAAINWNTDEGALQLTIRDGQGNILGAGEGGAGQLSAFTVPTGAERNVFIEVRSAGPRLQYDLEVGERIVAEGADLRVRTVLLSPAVAQPGQAIGAQFEVVNLGPAEAPETEAGIYLNDVADIRGGSFLGRIPVPAVPARSSLAVQGTFDLPPATADGLYLVGVQADSTELLDEGSDDDNVAFSVLRVDTEQACEADRLEPNGSPHEPNAINFAAPVVAGEYTELTSCYGDDDWYSVVLRAGESISADIAYEQDAGDLELALYAPDGETLLDESRGILGTDSVALARSEIDGTYFVRVFMKAGQEVNSNLYDIQFTIEDTDACQDDGFEPNETLETAGLIPDGLHDLRLCTGGEDWFRFAIPAGNTVSWQLTAGQAPLSITLFDPDGEQVDSDDRRIAHQAQQNGFYYVQVAAAELGEYVYQLRVSGVSGVDLAVDLLEPSRNRIQPGADLRVRTVVSNRRGDSARNIPIRYVLSLDEQFDANDLLLSERLIPLIDGAGELDFSQRISIPAGVIESLGLMLDMLPFELSLIAALDPERTVPDVRPANNEASSQLQLAVSCVDDDQRTNEGPVSAQALAAADESYAGVICPFTEDWFSLEVLDPGLVRLALAFGQDAGDLDLVVYDQVTGERLAESRTEFAPETLQFILDQPTTLLVQVDGFDEAEGQYELTWSLP